MYSKTWDEHVQRIKWMLEACKLKLNFKKCEFARPSSGHVVGNGELKMTLSKVEAIVKWPKPSTVSEVRSFVGATKYSHRLIKDYSSIAAPQILR